MLNASGLPVDGGIGPSRIPGSSSWRKSGTESRMNVRLLMGGIALVFGLAVAPAAAQERLVHQEVDRNTSAVIRVFKTAEGGRIELVTPALKVTKSIAGDRVVTRMSEGADQLVISTDRDTMAISTGAAKVTAARSDRMTLERGRQL